jgi:hypothetical protein
MSVKHNPRKDSSDKNMENQPRREAESYSDGSQAQSAQKPENKASFAKATATDHKHKD